MYIKNFERRIHEITEANARVQEIIEGPEVVYDSSLPRLLIESMEYDEKYWTIHFYGDVSVKIVSETKNEEYPRRLHRVTYPSPLKGTKRDTVRRKR